MTEQYPLTRSSEEDEHEDMPAARPHRDRPFTGDDAVDAALEQFDDSAHEPLGEQLTAAEEAHRALQARLGG